MCIPSYIPFVLTNSRAEVLIMVNYEKDEVTQMPALIYHQAFQGPFVNLLCSAVTNQTALIYLFTRSIYFEL